MFWFSTSPGFGKQKGSLQSCFSQLIDCKLSVFGNLIHSSPLQLKPRVLPPGPVAAGTPLEEEPDQKRWNHFLSQRKVHFKSSIRSSGSMVARLSGLNRERERKRRREVNLFPAELSCILFSTNCPRADKALSLPLLSRLASDSGSTSHSYSLICLFVFPSATFAPSKELVCQWNNSNLFHFKCIQKGIWIVPFHWQQCPNLELVKKQWGRFGICLLK